MNCHSPRFFTVLNSSVVGEIISAHFSYSGAGIGNVHLMKPEKVSLDHWKAFANNRVRLELKRKELKKFQFTKIINFGKIII